ncbi:proton-conducting transporter membrane subunit [Desulfuromonas sp. AOP6]|uniref:proton-conducting transporter transmembrane domain-containing protein n=1 Tax=Desulfuromonas sp. AOP6 TaxID=1566351 RepID=UPI0012802F84|nr:proton-conducting transporter membrane subunit [Desulfuromonas sp. AOP6]BCA80592.1 hydrogenase [Desulfuromonas sp. AOP6]
MTMGLFLTGILLLLFSGFPGLMARRQALWGERLSCLLTLLGTTCGLAAAIMALLAPATNRLRLPWGVPGAEFVLQLDALSALFLLPLFLVVSAGAVYGLGYWPQRRHGASAKKLRIFYGLIAGALMLVLTAQNSLLFLFAWEAMALAGFFLITTEDDKADSRRAGLIYLAATHTGTLALFALFALLASVVGSFAFPAAASIASAGTGTAIFLLGLFGFGLKAGIMPLHIWLPGAHAAAPSHASALLSGVMIKTGIYGLVRLTSFYADIPVSWGMGLLVLGAISGVLGVALALAQHDIKRLLAYHSVENIGIIVIGLAVALLGRTFEQPTMVLLGISGALLHTVNHGLFKSLLFLAAGSVIQATGTREMDHMGGLFRRLPWTAVCFLGGAVAICGLPPLNGFVSEWLIYLGAFDSLQGTGPVSPWAVLAAPVLALIGALAVACFVKVFGVVFLGEPRCPAAATAKPAVWSMRLPMLALLTACIWIGLLPWTLAPLLQRAATVWSAQVAGLELEAPLAPLSRLSLVAALLLVVMAGLWLWLQRRGHAGAPRVATWGCGYQFPAPRMQYSASSFADLLVGLFRGGLWTSRHEQPPKGLFPAETAFSSHTPDAVLDRFLLPLSQGLAWLFTLLRRFLQNGRPAFYLLYIALTLLTLLMVIACG